MKTDCIIFTFLIFTLSFFCSVKVECKNYGAVSETNHSKPINYTTPKGTKIRFIIQKEKYFLQWRNQKKFRTLDYPFKLEKVESNQPQFIAENKDYVLMRSNCGNPCWFGAFLPKNADEKPRIINEYFAYDLDQFYVCYLNPKNENIEILNLKTSKTQTIKTEYCSSAFKGYCIDTIYFKGKKLCFKWNNLKDSTLNKIAIKEIQIKV